MNLDLVQLICCPYCGIAFNIGDILESKHNEVINGYIRCGCSEFPILDGILNLKLGGLNQFVIQLLKRGETKKALGISLWKYSDGVFALADLLPGNWAKLIPTSIGILSNYIYKRYSQQTPFYNFLGTSESDIYLKHRFSAETLWQVYPMLPLLKNRDRILDIGCGTGHTSFIISNYAKPKEQVCADYAFRNLYLAKRYFIENADMICLDANYPLPFRNDIFDAVFMLDAFHYVNSHALLAKEMERILSPQGLLLLLHLHNSLSHDPSVDGKPLSPLNWISLFQNLSVKALSENNIVANFLQEDKLDLLKEYTETELNASTAISLIGSKDKSLFNVYKGIQSEFLSHKDNLIINPIYSINTNGEKVTLQRHLPSESFRKEFPVAQSYLPSEYIVGKKFDTIIKERTLDLSLVPEGELHYIEHLMRKFIVLNVPKNYCAEPLLSSLGK